MNEPLVRVMVLLQYVQNNRPKVERYDFDLLNNSQPVILVVLYLDRLPLFLPLIDDLNIAMEIGLGLIRMVKPDALLALCVQFDVVAICCEPLDA